MAGVARLRDQALPWVVIAVVVAAWTILQPVAVGAEAGHEAKWASEGGGLGFGGWWFLYVSRPIFSVLLVAWLWRLALVFVLLKRIARLDLSIVPTHPDGAGGLGFLKDLPKAFSLLAFATSAVVASRLAHDVIYHDVSLLSLKVVLTGFVVLVVVVCVAPLLALVGPLAAAKRRASWSMAPWSASTGDWCAGAGSCARHRKTTRSCRPRRSGRWPTPLALYEAVSRMRPVPFGKSTLLGIAVPTLIPILVLLSTQVPIKEVLKKIVGALL